MFLQVIQVGILRFLSFIINSDIDNSDTEKLSILDVNPATYNYLLYKFCLIMICEVVYVC